VIPAGRTRTTAALAQQAVSHDVRILARAQVVLLAIDRLAVCVGHHQGTIDHHIMASQRV